MMVIGLKFILSKLINPAFWDKAKNKVKNTVKIDSQRINQQLNEMEILCFELFNKFIEYYNRKPAPLEFKAVFQKEYFDKMPQFSKIKDKTFFNLFDDYIENKKIENPSTHTYRKYEQVKNCLLEFEKKSGRTITTENIDLNFRNEYLQFLQDIRNYAQTTIYRHMKFLKTVLLHIEALGYKINPQVKMVGYLPKDEISEKIALSERELAEMERLDLSDNIRLEQVRDRFLLGCYTGLRFSDFIRLNRSNIEDGKYILIRQQKTQKNITIPFLDNIKKIYEKYNYEMPRPISEVNFNLYLKEVARQCKTLNTPYETIRTIGGKRVKIETYRYEQVSTHTARRTFVTLNHAKGIELDALMIATGHTNIKTIRNYVKLNDKQNADVLRKRIEEVEEKERASKILKIVD